MQTTTILLLALASLPLCGSLHVRSASFDPFFDVDFNSWRQTRPSSWAFASARAGPAGKGHTPVRWQPEPVTVTSKPITIVDKTNSDFDGSKVDEEEGFVTIITKNGRKKVPSRKLPAIKKEAMAYKLGLSSDDCKGFDPNGNKIRIIVSGKHGAKVVDCRNKPKMSGEIIGPGSSKKTNLNKRPLGRYSDYYRKEPNRFFLGEGFMTSSNQKTKDPRQFFATLLADNQTLACSAVLIEPQLALTSRSCREKLNNQTTSLRLIVGQRAEERSCNSRNIVWVDDACSSPNFTYRPSISGAYLSEWDFSLLKLDQNALSNNSATVPYLNLSVDESISSKSSFCMVVKQTIDEDTGEIDINMAPIKLTKCWGQNETFFCFKGIGETGERLSTCQADSGGPIVCKARESTIWELVGIVSAVPAKCSEYNVDVGILNMATNLVTVKKQIEICAAQLKGAKREQTG